MASNSFGTLDDLKTYISPYLSVTPISLKNISSILDMNTFQPYLTFRVGSNFWESHVATESGDEHKWEENFSIDFNQNSTLIMSLSDKDDYGSDTFIASYSIPYSKVSAWKAPKKLVLSIPEEPNDEQEPLPFESFTSSEEGGNCVLVLELSYLDAEFLSGLKAEIQHHKNIVRGKEAYTLYEVVINRNDGHSWRVELRYSDFVVIRNEISQIIPGISLLPFPNKTYFDWLSRLCKCASRFNENKIKERKEGFKYFLNVILENIKEIECETVNNLLRIPNAQ